MATVGDAATANLTGLAQRLVSERVLDTDQIQAAQTEARKKRLSLFSYLVDNKKISAARLAEIAGREFGLPIIDLKAFDLSQSEAEKVSEKLIRKHNALPLVRRNKKLYVAIADPTNLPALDEIKFSTGMVVEPILVEVDKLQVAIDEAISANDTTLSDLEDTDLENIDLSSGEEEETKEVTVGETEDAPVVRFVNKILLDAINKGASDIHFEPYEKKYRVRLRLDGVLQEVANPPAALGNRLSARLKVLSRLDLAERRVPQDGRIKLNLSKTKSIDFRVSTCPTLWGEKVVMRILDSSVARLGIDVLGYEAEQKQLYLNNLEKAYGMILVTGPTGSGKSVSLYTGLNILNTTDRNISTAEDPVEINVEGINQVHVNPKVGLTFASALRAFLRQDPDVIMVGEIRDLETAEIAIKAAQTGHLVLSTLHTNDAPQTLTRLVNMGVPAYNIASSVNLIIAQRLLRRLCENCKQPVEIPREELLKEGFREDELDELTIQGPVGCDQCNEGYKGRVGIYQVMPVTEKIGRIIMEGGNAMQIEDQAQADGVINLREAGLNKIRAGITSLTEVNRVTVE